MSALRDFRLAVRTLSRAPGFALTAILALALGIGANTAIFSVVNKVLLEPLPYPEPDRLVQLMTTSPVGDQPVVSIPKYVMWRDLTNVFQYIAAYDIGGPAVTLTGGEYPEAIRASRVSADYFRLFGAEVEIGRAFSGEEDRHDGARVVVISHRLWRARFHGDPTLVGRNISLETEPYKVIGVIAPGFVMEPPADLWLPLKADPRSADHVGRVRVAARMSPGITLQHARKSVARTLGPFSGRFSWSLLFQEQFTAIPLRDAMVGDVRQALFLLVGAVGLVLLISCANVANLLLARAAAWQRELALRAALGARRGRLVRQTLTESILLATAGGAAGCALSFALLRLFVAMAPEGIPRLSQAGVDGRMLAFALLVSSAAGLLSGLAPALQNPRAESLAGWRALTARHHLFRHTLVAAQFAISLVLLAGASLLLRSLWSLADQPLGIRTRHVITATVTLGRKSYSESARRQAFFAELEARLRRIPGIEEVAVSDSLPPTGDTTHSMLYAAIDVAGRARSTDGTGGPVAWRYVTPRYFAALGIPILRGRAFVEDDRDPNRNVVILSDLLARRMFPGQDPLAQQIRPGRAGPWLSVIGVAANVKNSGPMDRDDPEYYLVRKFSADNLGPGATAILRSELEPRLLAGWVRGQIAALDPALPVTIETMQQRAGRLTARARFNALLLTIFAGVGLLLAAIGLYGVSSFLVAQRTGEIGVRVALGATSGAIAGLVLQQAACSTAAGALLGVAGSLFALRLLQAMLFHVSARDPLTLAAAVAVLSGSALLAAWVPSRRAARIDPMQALRRE